MVAIIHALGAIPWPSAVALCFASIFVVPVISLFVFMFALIAATVAGIPVVLLCLGITDAIKNSWNTRGRS